jgi:DNA-binding response OmpR family regulator
MDVLVIEDDPSLAEQVSRVLSRAGRAVQTAIDGPSGLKAVVHDNRKLLLSKNLLKRIRGGVGKGMARARCKLRETEIIKFFLFQLGFHQLSFPGGDLRKCP